MIEICKEQKDGNEENSPVISYTVTLHGPLKD